MTFSKNSNGVSTKEELIKLFISKFLCLPIINSYQNDCWDENRV